MQPEILQPIAGATDVGTLADMQENNNRSTFDFLSRVARIFTCKSRAPGSNDDSTKGFVPPALWVNKSTNTAYVLVDNIAGAAVWGLVTAGGASGLIEVQDEGVTLTTAATKFNFVGPAVTVTEPATDQMLVTIDSEDQHSGYKLIAAALTVTINAVKQMTVWGTLELDGQLNMDGELVVES